MIKHLRSLCRIIFNKGSGDTFYTLLKDITSVIMSHKAVLTVYAVSLDKFLGHWFYGFDS